ncbi:MAG: sulfite exporter TauE/SafE family protein [Ginsengibacter sp.]
MEIIGYIASVLIGVSLGLIGGGGSILTVPVLVYLFAIDPVMATGYSLFVVGSTSLAGAITKYNQGLINFKTAFIFAIPAVTAVLITRRFLLPAIPQTLFTIDNFTATKSLLLMIIFAVLMVFASVSMIRNNGKVVGKESSKKQYNYLMLFLQGVFVGFITGLVGAGGGFLIIPALVIFSKLPMKQAVATSLFIIAINNLIGFFSSPALHEIDWKLLFIITGLAIGGIFVGNWLSHKISGEKLKRTFGWFVLFMGIYIIIREIFFV